MKFENTEIFNFESAIRGMRNPLESWSKSDSKYCWYNNDYDCDECPKNDSCPMDGNGNAFVLGDNDLDLARRLINGGSEHRKFLRQIFVSVDITAPDYWFKEFSTYKSGVTENSTSTMHKIMSKPFTVDMFECKDMRGYKKDIIQFPNEIDEDTEEWKRHPIYDNYLISNQGRVRHLQYISNGRTMKEKIICGSLHKDGYLFVSVCLGGNKFKQVPKHRLVAETWIDNVENKSEVNHKDGNKQNNCVDNLEWCTSSENQQHAVDNGLQPKNVYTYLGKLSLEQRNEIKERYATEDISKRKLAEEYNVSYSTIRAILNDRYKYGENIHNEFEDFLRTIDELNMLREEYLITKDKVVWKTLIQKLPMNYLYIRTITMNYENLFNMCKQRYNHRLKEWSVDFINWVRTLPYTQEFIFDFIEGVDKEQ